MSSMAQRIPSRGLAVTLLPEPRFAEEVRTLVR